MVNYGKMRIMNDDSLVSGIIVRNSVNKLTNTIEKLDKKNEQLQKTMMYLTIATSFLVIVQVGIAILEFVSK